MSLYSDKPLEIDEDFTDLPALLNPEADDKAPRQFMHIRTVNEYSGDEYHSPNNRKAVGIVFDPEGETPDGKWELIICNHKGVSQTYWRENPEWEPKPEPQETDSAAMPTNITVPGEDTNKWSVLSYLYQCDGAKTSNQIIESGACAHATSALHDLHESGLIERERVDEHMGLKYRYEITAVGAAIVEQRGGQ